jgi:hypothetical protein
VDVRGTGKFHIDRQPFVQIIPLLSLAHISVIWNIRQYQVIEAERQHKIRTERQKADLEMAKSARTQAQREKLAKEAAANKRMAQLYREIDNLSQLNSQLLAQPVQEPKAPSDLTSLEAPDGAPRSNQGPALSIFAADKLIGVSGIESAGVPFQLLSGPVGNVAEVVGLGQPTGVFKVTCCWGTRFTCVDPFRVMTK